MSKASEKAPQAEWTTAMTRTLLNVLLDEAAQGRAPGNDFKPTSYEWAVLAVNVNRLGTTNNITPITIKQAIDKVASLKRDYGRFKFLTGQSGVKWIKGSGTVDMEASVWDRLIAENVKFARFRKKGLEFFNELDRLFQGKGATGPGDQAASQLTANLIQKNAAVPSSITRSVAGIQIPNTPRPAKPAPAPTIAPADTVRSLNAVPLPPQKAAPPPTTATAEAGKADKLLPGREAKGIQKRKSASVNGVSQNAIEDSVTIVRKEFMGTFNQQQLSIIWCFLEDRYKARMFMSLPKGHRKDWLLKQIKSYQWEQEDRALEREVKRLKLQKLLRECKEQGI
ncbi:hypothetical protein FPQ18DRAFT_309729 [Pyronema domesticum]|nr:hypothetical protein FPQ18DRAFT_309729 [Pyronema domesticum]